MRMVGLYFNLNSHYKFKTGLLVFVISVVFSMPFISNEAFANHMSEKRTNIAPVNEKVYPRKNKTQFLFTSVFTTF